MGRRSIAGSLVGGIQETQEMLDFAAEHGIEPKIEVIGADQVDGHTNVSSEAMSVIDL